VYESKSVNISEFCGCHKCVNSRIELNANLAFHQTFVGPSVPGWRYACEICGNKRCPHHSDHTLACTDSNEPGQPGSLYI